MSEPRAGPAHAHTVQRVHQESTAVAISYPVVR
jgi:hypothetical protein